MDESARHEGLSRPHPSGDSPAEPSAETRASDRRTSLVNETEPRVGPRDIDWADCHRRIRDSIRAQQLSDPEAVNDLAQVATIRLFRLAHREGIQEPRSDPAANRTWSGPWNSSAIRRSSNAPTDSCSIMAPKPRRRSTFSTPTWMVSAWYACSSLSTSVRNSETRSVPNLPPPTSTPTWEEIAVEQNEKVATIRKRWQRCLEKLRQQAEDWPEISNLKDSLER